MTARGSPAGIVFRRLDGDGDRRRAARLLPACVLDDHDATCQWYGLCDLTATEVTDLAGVVVVRSLGPRRSRLCALAVPTAHRGSGLGRRLVREVADRLRAVGVGELTASSTLDDRLAGLLRQEGFAGRGRSQAGGPVTLSLPL
ncbi:GNAT family N-acetyltransferase [Geodermatophilus sp. SYSU D00766]